uniref:Uncharacterized protein n=1 Tax=Sphaerodactylus townsendi TaxID=933632 RepID=A0ACB8E9K8_9SAUR
MGAFCTGGRGEGLHLPNMAQGLLLSSRMKLRPVLLGVWMTWDGHSDAFSRAQHPQIWEDILLEAASDRYCHSFQPTHPPAATGGLSQKEGHIPQPRGSGPAHRGSQGTGVSSSADHAETKGDSLCPHG